MAHILIMPRQGNTVESCIITGWKVKEGGNVSAETVICDVETDKASFGVPAGSGGTILKLLYEEGDDVPVLSPIAVIGEAGENWEELLKKESSHEDAEAQGTDTGKSSRQDAEAQSKDSNLNLSAFAPSRDGITENAISPRAKNLAEKYLEPEATHLVSGTGPGGRIIERDIKKEIANRPALTAAAKASGGAVPDTGSGLGGRVTKADITANLTLSETGSGAFTETPLKGIRKVIADRMLKSLSESAQFTLNASANAKRLQDLRSRMKASANTSGENDLSKISINDMILFAVSRILPQYLYMNAHLLGDTVRTFKNIHLGFAVDTPRGLMVPVIRNCQSLSITQLSSEAKRLAAACQEGKIKADELSGSTFTISNLGSLGITSFTPVLNIPEVAILGVCAMEMKPVVNNENCGCILEPFIGFSLTINHQAVDGAPAARFLNSLCETVADIDLLPAKGLE